MPPRQLPQLDLTGGLLAFLLPGLGHVYQGRVRRGLLAGSGVLALYTIGLLIGGLSIVDSRGEGRDVLDRIWFFGQILVGPLTLVVDQLHHRFDAPGSTVALKPALGKVYDMGVLFTAIAGLMNLVVLFDALMPREHPIDAEQRQPRTPPGPVTATVTPAAAMPATAMPATAMPGPVSDATNAAPSHKDPA